MACALALCAAAALCCWLARARERTRAGRAGFRLAATAATGLSALMTLLARREHGEADFTEEQYLAVLKAAAAFLRRAHLRGARSSGAAHRATAPADRGARSRRAHGAGRPSSRTLRLSRRAATGTAARRGARLLAGDRGALERLFTLRFSGALEHWQLQLEPRDAATRPATLERIDAHGERDQVGRSAHTAERRALAHAHQPRAHEGRAHGGDRAVAVAVRALGAASSRAPTTAPICRPSCRARRPRLQRCWCSSSPMGSPRV